ncbi:hypothetical protein Goarm_002235, partial [Gossypium armourianum]|nr:hypothetical protein [Gossypium armourianum]
TQISGYRADEVISKLGLLSSCRIEANGFSGGIWILWSDNVHHLASLTDSWDEPWLVAGDFNSVLYVFEKRGGSNADLGCCESQFTWSREGLSQRLDRAIGNAKFDSFAPKCLVQNVHRLKSYHHPVWVTLKPRRVNRTKYFHCLNSWFLHSEFRSLVSSNWNPDESVVNLMEKFRPKVQEWNKSVYRNIFSRKKQLIHEIKNIQRLLDLKSNDRLRRKELDLRQTLEDILKHEELSWFQKSRSVWLSGGDRNTKYFHGRTLTRRRRNIIKGLKLDRTNWCFDLDILKQHVVGFYAKLFALDYPIVGCLPCTGKFQGLSLIEKGSLEMKLTDLEIHNVIFGMSPLKAPGVDGFHARFYQSQWDIVGPSVCSMV